MAWYTVKYQFGPYEGVRTVSAEDAEQAIAKVRKWVRSQSTIPMAAQSFQVQEEPEKLCE